MFLVSIMLLKSVENCANLRIKAELLEDDEIFIERGIPIPYPYDKSSAGPSSSYKNVGFCFNKSNIKLRVIKNKKARFSLVENNGIYSVLKHNKIFINNVRILPVLYHAPNQIFINLADKCIFNCAFCFFDKKEKTKNYDKKNYVDYILKSSKKSGIKNIAITSGVYPNNEKIVEDMCYIVEGVRNKIPGSKFGVESCIFKMSELTNLKKSGFDEIKINVQASSKELFEKVCPNLDYNKTFNMLKEAVKVFGRGKVCSNIIFGLGETNESIIKTIKKLSGMGVVPTLRKIRINGENKDDLKKSLSCELPNVDVDRMIYLSRNHKKILEKNDLTTKSFNTMCHNCGCCDIVPFWDL